MQITMNRAITATGSANDTASTPDQCFTTTSEEGANDSNAAGHASTASSTSTIGGVVTDYRYALRAEAGPDSSWAASNPLGDNGEYYTLASDYNSTGNDADGNAVVYIATDDAIASNIEVTQEAVAASEEVYVVDIIEAIPVTLPDTIYVEETTVSVATRTKLAD